MAQHRTLPHQQNGRYFNEKGERPSSFFFGSLIMFAQALLYRRLASDRLKTFFRGADSKTFQNLPSQPRITWLGHSTFLLEIGGLRLLTDPIFSGLLFFPRLLPPGIPLKDLPFIDAVLISHNHYDHMDEESLRHLFGNNSGKFLVPMGDAAWFERKGCHQAKEFMWWQSTTLSSPQGGEVRITFLPARHWSQRGMFDRNKSLWGSFMIEYAGATIYFAGDTAYGAHFQEIAQEFSPIDIALMPIGPCEPREGMKKSHISAEEAGKAFLDLQAHQFVPMHWGTFAFGMDDPLAPLDRLVAWWQQEIPASTAKKLYLVQLGQPLELSETLPHISLENEFPSRSVDPI